MKSSEGKGIKKILSLVNGKWVKWNGKDDCKCLLIKENITLADYKKYYEITR